MSIRARSMILMSAVSAALPGVAHATNHLVISEVVAAPSAGEYIEIYNPLSTTVDLSRYFLADNPLYARITPPGALINPASNDFIVRFPDGSSIAPGATIVVAMNAEGFITTYSGAGDPDFELPIGKSPVPDMLPATPSSVGFSRGLSDAGEGVILFFWDGLTDLVQDVDIIRVGQPSGSDNLQDKGTLLPLDGPDPDSKPSSYLTDALTMPTMTSIAAAGFSYKRLYLEGALEVGCGGNGLTGHDETTENIAITWDGSGVAFTIPTPGEALSLTNPPGQCPADIVDDNVVNIDDLLAVISAWGACANCGLCPADIAPATCLDCTVDIDDLLSVISAWGPCP